MRKIISISLPEEYAEILKKKAEKRGQTVSRHIQDLIEQETNLISEEELLEQSKRAEERFKKGETKAFKSLSEIL